MPVQGGERPSISDRRIEWSCYEDNKEDRKLLEMELPGQYKYRVSRFKIAQKSTIDHESKFEAEFAVNICNEETLDQFVIDMEEGNGTSFVKRHSDRKDKTGGLQKAVKCSRNVLSRLSEANSESGKKGNGSGRLKGLERQPGKNQNCSTTMNLKLKKCIREDQSGCHDCFNLKVKITYDHSHEVESTESWNFQEVGESARLRLLELFEDGLTPARAKQIYDEELKEKFGNDWLTISAQRSINPDKKYVNRLHTSYMKGKFGTINGADAYQKAVEFIAKYNENAGETLASIQQLDNREGTVIVCVVDQFMKRTHQIVPQSGQIMFVDCTGSLDRMNHQLLKLMTESPAGGLPLGFIVLSDQKEESLDAGFKAIKNLMPAGAFCGRGAEKGPELIMTDDDPVSILS